MRRAARLDGNHKAIVEAYEKRGARVLSLAAVGRGVPDLLVCYRGRVHLVEVKMPQGKLRQAQDEFLKWWPVRVVRDEQDVIAHLESFRC